ncbi:alanine racemase [Kineococcus radiotolerans]|uniref:Alanine racemase n=1 Tax=Kineococcus radiotolerans TaxID=131568 RepID=A0A7W4XW29_KINRA|nr:alanine racemase [Kineococcus radiotolerans]MBB2900616.1 alanine racemase [Kineococcus radiotolerans]
MQPRPGVPAEAVVDLDAIARNVAVVRERVGGPQVMAVVKADAYGHGLVPAARAALAGGATWLGVAHVHEALALRGAGVEADLLAWILTPGTDLVPALRRGVDVSVAAVWALEEVVAAARASATTARIHLEVDTGMSRGGASPEEWPALLDAVAGHVADGTVRVRGTWAHFASADVPGDPSVPAQLAAFEAALGTARRHGVEPGLRHHANSAAALFVPQARYDLVRVGLAAYGLSPAPDLATGADLGLVPAMTLQARLAHVRRVPRGAGVSYGLTYTAERDTTLGLVPLGYGDGLPRHASWDGERSGEVLVAGARRRIAGRVCMDQVVLDLGDDAVAPGEVAVVLGPGTRGEATADDWARAAGTISWEIVTRVGARVPRRYTGRLAADLAAGPAAGLAAPLAGPADLVGDRA